MSYQLSGICTNIFTLIENAIYWLTVFKLLTINYICDKIVVALRRGLILYLGTHNNEGGIFKHRINHYYEQGFSLSFTSLTITN